MIMETRISLATTLGTIAAKYPQTRAAMEEMGLDYCCGGKRTLEQSIAEAGRSPEDVLTKLDEAIETPTGEQKDFTTMSPAQLVDHIESTHHAWLREHLPRLSRLLEKVLLAHGAAHGDMLRSLAAVVEMLRADITLHLQKEEQILFPYIRGIEACHEGRETTLEMHCGTVQNPIRQMESEHDEAAEALSQMHEITDAYSVPDDGCETFKALYDELQALERDLHQHIHLENNVLFPKAVTMEEEVIHQQST